MTVMSVMDGIPHLLWALWTTSWQAGMMAGAVWLACRQWPRMPANLRIVLWWLVSLKFVLGLVWTQPIPLPVLPASMASADRPVARSASAAPVTTGSNAIPSVEIANGSKSSGVSLSPASAVAGLWLLGVFVQGMLLVRQLIRTRRLIARSLPVEGDAAELFDDLVARLDVRASQPRLRVSTEIATPQVTGLTRPVILLPVSALESFSTPELSLTLCHELMHVKRFDLWHGWIPSAAARLFFFHPLAHLAAREYAIAREAACDARVLTFMDAPAYDYGRLLMRLGITAREAAPAVAGASPTLHTLKRRLLMLHDAPPHARRLSPRWWVLAAIAALLVIPMRPTAAQPNPPNVPNVPNTANVQSERNQRNAANDEPWVYLQDDESSATHGSSADVAEAKRQRANASEPLLWFKRDGRAYVIRERQVLEKVRGLFMPQEQLHMAMHGLEQRQRILGDEQTALGAKHEAMSEQMRALDEKLNEANAALQKTIPPPPRPSEDARLQVREELRMRESLLREAAANHRDAAAHQEALAFQQRMLAEREASLGAEQAALARQEEEASRQVEREMRNLFDAALAAGAAAPVTPKPIK